jgi:hypothetical protein
MQTVEPLDLLIGWKRSLLNFLILILMKLLSQIFLMRLNLSSWQSREIQNLYHEWHQVATARPPSGERMTSVETWFIDPTRFPHCAQRRIAALHPEVQFWKREFRRLRADHVDPTVEFDVHIVRSHPQDASPDAFAQIVLYCFRDQQKMKRRQCLR